MALRSWLSALRLSNIYLPHFQAKLTKNPSLSPYRDLTSYPVPDTIHQTDRSPRRHLVTSKLAWICP